jgi:hypothetical protein
MLTIIPKNVAEGLTGKTKIENFNNLPQLRKEVLGVLREFVRDEIGFESMPLAGLCQRRDLNGKVLIKKDFADYIPVNAKDSVLLILEIPEDQIVSINYKTLLDMSEKIEDAADDRMEVEYLKDSLYESLRLGPSTASNDISFIPFLDCKKCKYFAVFNSQLEADKSFNIPGVNKIPMQELTFFNN